MKLRQTTEIVVKWFLVILKLKNLDYTMQYI